MYIISLYSKYDTCRNNASIFLVKAYLFLVVVQCKGSDKRRAGAHSLFIFDFLFFLEN